MYRRLLVLSVASLVTLACSHRPGGGGGGDDGENVFADRTGAAVEIQKVLCDITYDCPGTRSTFAAFAGLESVQACKSLVEEKPRAFLRASRGDFLAILFQGGIELQPDHRARCLQQLEERSCAVVEAGLPAACREYLAPALEEGDDCRLDYACKGRLRCEMTQSCPGECVDPGESTSPCGGCGEDEYCARSDDEPTCKPHKQTGDSCTSSVECGLEARCNRVEGEDSGECTAWNSLQEGDSCGSTLGLCGKGLACTNGTCQSIEVNGEGGTCSGIGGRGASACEPSLRCVVGQSGGAECTALKEQGEECIPDRRNQCQPGLFCSSEQKCEELAGIGEPCDRDEACASLTCIEAECRELDICRQRR